LKRVDILALPMEKITQEELLMILQVHSAQMREVLGILGAFVTAIAQMMPPPTGAALLDRLAKATAKFEADKTTEDILRRFEGPLQ
jgi:hypothetical protein